MKHLSLATRYRPQRFDDVAGQDLIKAVLSRASAEDRVASGYLLSGTRGVGKTTIARIFAKALNCAHAPCGEPCNECEQCRRITAGTHPDVLELDGASNNSVEDARALRENVGFAPMEGRYKIFIIDEAHMLTRSAFNALLKTLEEPPAHVVFIFATTEIFRFPATILSRCQVFSFRHLSEDTITAHLGKILNKEGMPYEESAVRLIARRAAGSARDSMSLLDQILAYGQDSLTADTVRTVLGLAGIDALENLFRALATGNCAEAALFTRDLVSREIDIGFFLRELTDHLRSLFLLHQCNREAVARLGVPEGELDFLAAQAPHFTPSYLHAAWQMVLESQRNVSTSQEPAAALELLLVNLALLPRLLPAELAAAPAAAPGTGQGMPPHPRTGVEQPGPSTLAGAVPGTQASWQANRPRGDAGQMPAARQPATQPPLAQQPATQPPVTQQPLAQQPATRSLTAQQPGIQPPAENATAPAARPAPGRTPGAGEAPQAAGPATAMSGQFAQAPGTQAGQAGTADTRTQPAAGPHAARQAIPGAQPAAEPASGVAASAVTDAGAADAAATGFGAMQTRTYRSPGIRMPDHRNTATGSGASVPDFTGAGGPASGTPDEQELPLPDWNACCAFAQEQPDTPGPYLFKGVRCVSLRRTPQGNRLTLEGDSSALLSSLKRSMSQVEATIGRFLGMKVQVELKLSEQGRNNMEKLRTPPEYNRPELQHCFEILKAHVEHVQRKF